MGETYQAGWARLREAEAHLAERHRAPAATALRQAHAAADELGAENLRAAVDAVAARSRLAVEEPAQLPAQRYRLSARERDVLVLVARGLTDRQIGEELFISHRTVERHVSSILAKLDARTRAEVASIAHRDGLVPVP
jgi:DNA-binding NarL/FixJ family response regulator